MDSFPLSDLNWAQKYICKIKTDTKKKNAGGTVQITRKLHIQQLLYWLQQRQGCPAKSWSKCQWFCLFTAFFCFYCGIKWIHTNIKHLLTLWIHNDKQGSHQHVVSLVEMLCFTIWCWSNNILMPYLYSRNFDFDRILPFTCQISFISQQTIFLFYQLRCALKSASPPWWGYKWLSHAGCT